MGQRSAEIGEVHSPVLVHRKTRAVQVQTGQALVLSKSLGALAGDVLCRGWWSR